MHTIDWTSGTWTHEPRIATTEVDGLVVEAAEGSDAWRHTSYGFVHASEHALLAPLGSEAAVEVDFDAEMSEQFDQAGLFLAADEEHWIKAGVEFADGALQVGAVVTWPRSDWSVAPVPGWNSGRVSIRASRSGDAITVRARSNDGPWQLVRVIPVPPEAELRAGPFVAAPTRRGLVVRFTGWRVGEPDASLH